MQINVNDVLKLKGFAKAKVVAGEKGLSNMVNNATIMEVPDIYQYVDANNLLITTLYPISHDETVIKELIPKLVELNLAGICIKPARYIKEINQVMIDQANESNFPVISLPEDANLSELVSEILELSLKLHMNDLRFRNSVHQKLMKLFLDGADKDSMVNALAKLVKFPIMLLDNSFNITVISEDLKGKYVSIELKLNKYRKPGFKVRVDEALYDEDCYLKHYINAGRRSFGCIVLLKDENTCESLRFAIEQASMLIASVFYKDEAVLEKEKSILDAFIRDILQGRIYSSVDAINRAKSFGWDMEFPMIVMVVSFLIDDDKRKQELYEHTLDCHIINHILEKELGLCKKRINTVCLDDLIVVFVNTIIMEDTKKKFLNIGNLIIKGIDADVKIGIGISNVVKNIQGFSLAYNEAQGSVTAGSVLNHGSFVNHFSDYCMFDIIKEIKNMEILASYVDNKLGRILQYDEVNEGQFMETLKVLIENNFNIKESAKKLFIHYNTLRYRIDKIKELGIKIDNGFEVGELVMAYNIYLWIQQINRV